VATAGKMFIRGNPVTGIPLAAYDTVTSNNAYEAGQNLANLALVASPLAKVKGIGINRAAMPDAPETVLNSSETTAEGDVPMRPQLVQQAQGKPVMTQWGWQNSPSWRTAAKVIDLAGRNTTLTDVLGKIPTQSEAVSMIESQGG